MPPQLRGARARARANPRPKARATAPGNASAVAGGKGNAFSGQVLASKGKGLVWLLSGDGKGLASKGSASAVAGGKGNAAEGKGNAPGSASATSQQWAQWGNSWYRQNHALCLRWARAVTDHWAPGKRQRTSSQPSSSAEWTEVAQNRACVDATECRARAEDACSDRWRAWRRLQRDAPPGDALEEYEQLTLNYNNYHNNVPDDSSSSSSYVDSDQASWWEDDPEVQHLMPSTAAGLVEVAAS